jgi:menaquinone-dependent protoporphyrinogen oxidase
MQKRVLVTFATRAGATAGVAEAIGQTLAERGLLVDVRRMLDVHDLSSYQAVVAGSAIRGGSWLSEALDFVRNHQAELKSKPFAAFMVCITLAMKNGENYRAGIANWMKPVRDLVPTVSEGLFAGMLDFSKLPLNMDTLRLRATVAAGVFPKGDHRDWEAIRQWAESLPPLLFPAVRDD